MSTSPPGLAETRPVVCAGVTIGALEPHHCRWTMDGRLYCGKARGGRGPAYCNEHAAVAYTAAGLRHYEREANARL